MLTIKVRFDRNMKAKIVAGTFDALKAEIEKRLSPKYPELNVMVYWNSQMGVDISGLPKGHKKEDIESVLQEIWEDGSWVSEKIAEDIEYIN